MILLLKEGKERKKNVCEQDPLLATKLNTDCNRWAPTASVKGKVGREGRVEQCSNGTYESHLPAKITTWTQRMFLMVLPKFYEIDIEPKLGSKQVLLNQHSKSANRTL